MRVRSSSDRSSGASRPGARARAALTLTLTLSLALLASTPRALAQSASAPSPAREASPAPPDLDAAKRAFTTGSDRMRDGAYEEALAAFVASNRALPSPNTTLLIARCLRELGRPEEAVERFETAAVDAEARVAAGESRYQQAASSARTEGASLRANLGMLHLRLVDRNEAARVSAVEVDARRSPIRSDGTVDVLHRPGELHYRVLEGDTVRVEGRAVVTAGRWTSIDVVVPARRPRGDARGDADIASSAPAREPSPAPAWMMPLAIGAGAVGVVGLGSFAFFGLRSQATFDSLRDRCAPRCGAADRDEASRGDTEQTVANVSLAVGAVALTAGITLAVIVLTHRSPSASGTTPSALGSFTAGTF